MLHGFLATAGFEQRPALVGVSERVFWRAGQGGVDRAARLLSIPQFDQRHGPQVRAIVVVGVDRQSLVGGVQGLLPVVGGEPDPRQEPESSDVLGVQPNRLLDGQAGLVASSPAEEHCGQRQMRRGVVGSKMHGASRLCLSRIVLLAFDEA